MALQLDVTDEETRALLNLLVETIEADRYRRAPVSTKSMRAFEPLDPHAHRQLGAIASRMLGRVRLDLMLAIAALPSVASATSTTP